MDVPGKPVVERAVHDGKVTLGGWVAKGKA
jgi:hypothetical protein